MILLTGGYFIFGGSRISRNVVSAGMIEENSVVKFSLSEVSETAEFYNYRGIEFFVVRASDGSIKTAFNTCDVCYSAKKGYRQEGTDMVCKSL